MANKKAAFTPGELGAELSQLLILQQATDYTGSVTVTVHMRDGGIGKVIVKTENTLQRK